MYHLFGDHLPRGYPLSQVEPSQHLTVFAGSLGMHDPILARPAQHIADVAFHAPVIVLQHIAGAVLQVIFPGNHAYGRSPGRSASASRLPRCPVGNISGFFDLGSEHVLHPFMIEVLCIEIMQDRHTGHLAVPRVGGTFPVGTIAGYSAMHVVGLAASPDLIDLIE